MRRLFFQMMVSADGSMAGPDGELDWHIVDGDFSGYVDQMLRSIDAILLGRRTYEGLSQYWPDAREPEAPLMNALPKIVFSTTLGEAAWSNSRVVDEEPVRAVSRLMAQPGNDLALFASSTLAATLADAGLIDEFRIIVSPLFLGQGQPVLPGLAKRIPPATRADRDIRLWNGLPLLRTRMMKGADPVSSGRICVYERRASWEALQRFRGSGPRPTRLSGSSTRKCSSTRSPRWPRPEAPHMTRQARRQQVPLTARPSDLRGSRVDSLHRHDSDRR